MMPGDLHPRDLLERAQVKATDESATDDAVAQSAPSCAWPRVHQSSKVFAGSPTGSGAARGARRREIDAPALALLR